jgi:hypothetical protein
MSKLKTLIHGDNKGALLKAEQGLKEFFSPASQGDLSGNPLTRIGEQVIQSMKRHYGEKKGEDVFYASINKGISGSKKWHRKK